MEDYPAKIADLLETVATRIRTMTVDRVKGWVTWGAVGLVAAMLATLVLIFLLIGLFRLLAELVGVEPAYLILGGIPAGRDVVVVAPAPQGRRERRGSQCLTSHRPTSR